MEVTAFVTGPGHRFSCKLPREQPGDPALKGPGMVGTKGVQCPLLSRQQLDDWGDLDA
jgi:hypothetical protein